MSPSHLVALVALIAVLLAIVSIFVARKIVCGTEKHEAATMRRTKPRQIILLSNTHGVFSFFLQIIDWLVCIEQSRATAQYAVQVYWEDKGEYLDSTCQSAYRLFSNRNLWSDIFVNGNESNLCSGAAAAMTKSSKSETLRVVCGYPQALKNSEPGNIMFRHIQVPPLSLFNDLHGVWWMNPSVFTHKHFPTWRQLYASTWKRHIAFTPEFSQLLDDEMRAWKQSESQGLWVGFHLRAPSHYTSSSLSTNSESFLDSIMRDIATIVQQLNKDKRRHHKIYIATEYEPFLKRVQTAYPAGDVYSRLIPRVSTDADWTMTASKTFQTSYLELIKNTLLDALLLSHCDYVVGSSSNMFLAALVFNPTVPYRLFPTLAHVSGK